ncbi:MAG: virulence factor SrfB, partial [Rhodobacteraceae bacterium]|nr:virulence factor SrfB [Paracoccaceae bacterium]
MMAVPPHRLVSMHRYRTGRWFPFRDPVTQRIGDPKSTVAVGGMLIALADKHIANFTVPPGAFGMRSTARYIGEMDLNEQIPDARLLFRDVDLDGRAGGSAGGQTASVAMFAPIHIGARQLPLDRWTTTPLYRLDFAGDAARRRPTPLRVTLERAEFDEGDEDRPTSEDILRREALREAFRISEVEDGAGDGMKPSDIVLKLHTLGFQDDYWIDTGVFQI